MTLEEIKAALVERIDTAWNEIKDQTNADSVRTYVQGLTAELTSHVYAVEAALVNHVLGKQDTPAPVPTAPAAPAEPTAGNEQPPAAAPAPVTETAPTEAVAAAPSVPDSSAQANPTGMASNPEQAPADTTTAPAAQ